ncbi:hypothetical protein [Microvirga alba]|uniref:Uncharacterized protein n=1 Tax=Microvirga alba TaxID=2791025 RepID=A0A931BTQ9_9HYPH|nr:hypothetical protein [Microvirga alba]MBF9235554.1 hypothetical protein [Microvirga alba]
MKQKLMEFLGAAIIGTTFAFMLAYGLDYQLQIEEAQAIKAAAQRQAEEGAAK